MHFCAYNFKVEENVVCNHPLITLLLQHIFTFAVAVQNRGWLCTENIVDHSQMSAIFTYSFFR